MSARVAILHGDQVSRPPLCSILADAGYEPSAFVAGIGVHEVLRDLAPAAIILDVPHDPSTLHWSALAAVAHDATLRPIPFLACVPANDDATPRQIAALGLPSLALVCKPVSPAALLARLRRLIGQTPRAS